MHVFVGVMGFLGRAELILEADDCHAAVGPPPFSWAAVRAQQQESPHKTLSTPPPLKDTNYFLQLSAPTEINNAGQT